jgi:hypothetical protein
MAGRPAAMVDADRCWLGMRNTLSECRALRSLSVTALLLCLAGVSACAGEDAPRITPAAPGTCGCSARQGELRFSCDGDSCFCTSDGFNGERFTPTGLTCVNETTIAKAWSSFCGYPAISTEVPEGQPTPPTSCSAPRHVSSSSLGCSGSAECDGFVYSLTIEGDRDVFSVEGCPVGGGHLLVTAAEACSSFATIWDTRMEDLADAPASPPP